MNFILANSVWDTIYNTFSNIFLGIGQAVANNIIMAILTFSILLILVLYRTIRNRYTTEITTYNSINKINGYLAKNPFITEENLVEFNRLMMKAPKTLRFQWQRYIINRDKKPSDFLSEENCVVRPLRTNSYKQGLKTFLYSTIALSIFSALFLISSFIINIDSKLSLMLLSLIIPGITLFIAMLYVLFGNLLYNAIMSDLYYSYSNFEKYIDRAVSTMPEAIDYEIIFTPKEIQNGIPALQEFLEQRAIYDQKQLEKAKESEVEHETYNFDALGVNGSLVMQRALKESEIYLGNRRRLLAEIETIQSEKSSIQKDFDEENKNYQRSLRDIREEISSLKNKIEVVTNEITRSSLRRQQSAEVEKEQNVEKEIEKATNKYNERIDKLNEDINKTRQEIEESKIIAEKSLTDEFKHFSDKTYVDLKKVATDEVNDRIISLMKDKDDLSKSMEEKDKYMAEKLSLYEDKVNSFDELSGEVDQDRLTIDELKNQISNLNEDLENKNQDFLEVSRELENRNKELDKKNELIANYKKKKGIEIYRYFDANGNEFYFDDNDNAYYLDEEGNAVYFDSNANQQLNQQENSVDEFSKDDSKLDEMTEDNSNVEQDNAYNYDESAVEEFKEESISDKDEENEESNLNNEEDDSYKGMQDTLNKLAKAAEEKMKQVNLEVNKQESANKKSKKNKKKK